MAEQAEQITPPAPAAPAQSAVPGNLYPTLRVNHIQDPSRLYAVPLLGILIKVIICIPIYIELFFVGVANLIITLINSFYVLFTGTYWNTAYELNLGILRLWAKLMLFFSGLTNKYPGFSLSIDDPLISLDMTKPEIPGRFFAFPLLGGLVRIILLLLYFIYAGVIGNAASIGSAFIASFTVLFTGKYSEFAYELGRDSLRLTLATSAYLAGFTDSYPSFWISMNHKVIKIVLIILGALFMLSNYGSGLSNSLYPVRSKSNYYTPKTIVEPSPFNQYTPGLQTQ